MEWVWPRKGRRVAECAEMRGWYRQSPTLQVLFALAVFLVASVPLESRAECNVIPGAVSEYRGALGSVNRPFGLPGDEGEEIGIRLRPGACDPGLSHFGDRGGAPGGEDDYFVSLLFEPPGSGAHHAVVIGAESNVATCEARVAAAGSLANGGTATCLSVPATGKCSTTGSPCSSDTACAPGVCVAAPGEPDLSVRSECVGGSSPWKRCTQDSDCPGATCEPVVLMFRFPDTDPRVGGATDDRTLTGPVTIAVTPVSASLPFTLSASTMRCADSARPANLVACIDELYSHDGTCETGASDIDETFGYFTALPPANDYRAMCTTGGSCDGSQDELRFTVDRAGNVLIPMDYRGVLIVNDLIPIPRILSASTSIEAFAGGGVPVNLPSGEFLSSHAPGGQRLPPLFTPLRAEVGGADPPLALFGSVDAPVGVIRIARKGPGTLTCSGGANAGNACTSDAQCPSAECALFEFRDRFDGGVGPVLIAGSAFDAEAQEPVALDGLIESSSMFAFVTSEAIENTPLNADADTSDPVLRLRDRMTGELRPIGALPTTPGRAVTRVRDGAFRFPAVAVEEDVVAFLESEPLEANTDANGNGELVDSILRVYRMQPGSAAQALTSTPITADAAPLVDGRSVAVSNGKVFFRTSESEESPRVTEVVSRPDGVGGSEAVADPVTISADGRYVAFVSGDPDLTDPPAQFWYEDVYVRDRFLAKTVRVSPDVNFLPSGEPSISADGRFVAFIQESQLWLHDRDADGDGSFDPPGAVTTELVSRCKQGGCRSGPNSNGRSMRPAVSADGRFVAFTSYATDMISGHPFTEVMPRVFLRDRAAGQLVPVSLDDAGNSVLGNTAGGVCVSSDGRFVAYSGWYGFVVHDLDADGNGVPWYQEGYGDWPGSVPPHFFKTERADVTSDGGNPVDGGLPGSFGSCISDDGRFATFYSYSPELVAGDTNGTWDVFVRDRVARTTTRVSVAPNGEQGNNASDNPAISRDGRFVVFSTEASNLDDDVDVGRCIGGSLQGSPCTSDGQCGSSARCATPRDVLIADLATGHLRRVSTSEYSSDTGTVADAGLAATFIPHSGPASSIAYGFVRSVDSTSSTDRTGDGGLDDTVLRVIDTAGGSPGTPADLCPALAVAVASGRAAFLRPEAAGASATGGCPQATADQNGDGDAKDAVVQLWPGSSIVNLGLAATDVALSPTRLAALVSEADQGAQGTSLNGAPLGGGPTGYSDDDKTDRVLFVCAVDEAAPGSCADGGVNTGLAADAVAVSGDVMVVAVPEASQGNSDLNNDGDSYDRVLRIYRADTGVVIPVDQAVEDFVVEGNVVAFRTREKSQGDTDLNNDGDRDDDVLQAYDLATGQLVSSGMAVLPCPVEACDPRFPYRVSGEVVTFVTHEAAQGADLNGDGDSTDLVKQVFNVRKAVAQASPALLERSVASSGALASSLDAVTAIGSASAGVCTTSGSACWSDAECGGGRCFVPPGQCVQDLGTACDPRAAVGAAGSCSAETFCVSTGTGTGTCHVSHGECRSQSECTLGGICTDTRTDRQRLAAPVATGATAAGEWFMSSGRCIRPCMGSGDCEAGDVCEVVSGVCGRARGACVTTNDCDAGFFCTTEASFAGQNAVVTVVAADWDGDGLVDPIDNCPQDVNVDQADEDLDGIGDACDVVMQMCGNATVEGSEACDDGNVAPGDGCSAVCTVEHLFTCSGVPSACVPDRDADGLSDDQEIALGTNPDLADSDGDGLQDGVEVVTHGTNPLVSDTDGDGVSDAEEVGLGFDPRSADSVPPVQRSTQAACLNARALQVLLLTRARGIQIEGCGREYAKGPYRAQLDRLGGVFSAASCIGADVGGKRALREQALVASETLRCTGIDGAGFAKQPGIGFESHSVTIPVARGRVLDLFSDLFGTSVDSTLVFTDAVVPGSDRQGSLCQFEMWERTQTLYYELWKQTLKAQREALTGRKSNGVITVPAARTAGMLARSIELRLATDPTGALSRRAAGVRTKGAGKCEDPARPTVLTRSELFPGRCQTSAQASFGALADCVTQSTRRRFCQQLAETGGFSLDCDVFDGGAQGSCAP